MQLRSAVIFMRILRAGGIGTGVQNLVILREAKNLLLQKFLLTEILRFAQDDIRVAFAGAHFPPHLNFFAIRDTINRTIVSIARR